jgi:oxygen-independent coproporphyrinogen-3 oxidase
MEKFIRHLLLKSLTGEREITLRRKVPSREELVSKFESIDALGLYLHIPFCEQICPYCPYNKELYRRDLAERYTQSVKKEIDFYSTIAGGRPITSLYIGGGTPTTMLDTGLSEILGHLRDAFNLQCPIHMESHPNHLSAENLKVIRSMGIDHLSIGVEALQDRHLRSLCRPYTASAVKEAVGRAVSQGFNCVNVDVMFALPGQTNGEIEQTGNALVEMGVDQVAAYPLFRFPYTPLGKRDKACNHGISQVFKRRKMLSILERIFYQAGYERTSAWAFTKRGVPRYCSVTVPLYLGLGASGGSYLRDVFYLNTFGVSDYIEAMENGRIPIALSVDLTDRMQKAGWMYWRIYETKFRKTDYRERFGEDLDRACGRYLRLLAMLGFLKDDGERILLSDRGSFWLHAFEDILSIDYISKLWGTSKREMWPEEVIL